MDDSVNEFIGSLSDKCFTVKYLRQYESITTTTINTLIANGFRDKKSLIKLNSEKVLNQLFASNPTQRAVLNVALSRLQREDIESDSNRKRTVGSDNESDKDSKRMRRDGNKENVTQNGCKESCNQRKNKNKRKSLRKTVSNKQNINKSDEELDNDMKGKANDKVEPSEEGVDQSVVKTKNRFVATLEALIISGCFLNFERKSTIIKEYSKYCSNSCQSIEMVVNVSTAYDLMAERKTIEYVFQKCPNLKCLRLSYCKVSLKAMYSLKKLLQLQCLHMEYIFGLDSTEDWTKVGHYLGNNLVSLAFNADSSQQHDISGMVSKLKCLNQLSLEEYNNKWNRLFSSIQSDVTKLSVNNYYNIDVNDIKVLSNRLSKVLLELELIYDSYHMNRANANVLFSAICDHFPKLRVLRFKFISLTDFRPINKLKQLTELNLHFSALKFIDFLTINPIHSLRSLSLTKILLNSMRIYSIAKAFPYLRTLSLSANPNKDHTDSPLFCCECRNKDNIEDNCVLCYENCAIALIEFTYLKVFELNYVRVKSSLVYEYIPKLARLVINPFNCQCGSALLRSAIKIANLRQFTLEIRKCFISEALNGLSLPENLHIIEYNKYKDK